MDTKKKILDAALELFSVHGYEDTTVSAIAEAVGIRAPSLYKHYKSKQDIFQAILEKIRQDYEKQAALLQLDGSQPEEDALRYLHISPDQLVQAVLRLFRFFLQDPYAAKCRRMLTLEQYRSSPAGKLYLSQYFLDPLHYQEELFRQLIRAGVLKNADPQILALQFYGPIFTLLQLCDSAPSRVPEAEKMLESHILEFNRLHKQEVSA